MRIHRSFRPQRRTVAIVAAATAVAIAVSVRLSGVPAPHRIAQAADVSQASATALCSAAGPGGTWTISTAGIATLTPGGTSPAASGPCTNISLPDASQAGAIQQCASALQAAQQQFQQETASVLFKEFMTNLIQNNATRWASALASQGYQGPAPSATSQQVSNAIDQVSATNSDLANAVAQALMGLFNHGFDTPVDCAAAESDPNWYSNAFQALADDDLPAQLENQALNAVASQIQQWASQASAGFTVQPGPSNTPLQAAGGSGQVRNNPRPASQTSIRTRALSLGNRRQTAVRSSRPAVACTALVTISETSSSVFSARPCSPLGWWHSFRDVLPNPFEVYIGLEAGAVSIRNFELYLVGEFLITPPAAETTLPSPALVRRASWGSDHTGSTPSGQG